MANAFLLRPLAAAYGGASSLVAGQPSYLGNDYAGVTATFACDAGANVGAIRVDFGADVTFDTIMVFGLAQLPTSATCAVLVAPSATGVFAPVVTGLPAYAGSAPRTDGKGVTLARLTAPAYGRYVQINYNAPSAGALIEASRIVIGTRFEPNIGFEYGAQFGVRDLGALDVNARGVLLRHRGKKLRTVSLNFPLLTKQEAEGTAQKLLEQVGNTECIALCTDPAPDAERQSRCYFGPLVGDLTRTWASARGHELRANLLGLM